MRRLPFPLALDSLRICLKFKTTRAELEAVLGPPGFVETDGHRTAGGDEAFWGFEFGDGVRMQIDLHVPYQLAYVTLDPNDPARAETALRALGIKGKLTAVEDDSPEEFRLCWLFTGDGSQTVTGLFATRTLAARAIATQGFSGVLRPKALNRFGFEDMELLLAKRAPQMSLRDRQAQAVDHDPIEFLNGQRVPLGATFQVLRTTLHVVDEVIAEYALRLEAVGALEAAEQAQPTARHRIGVKAP